METRIDEISDNVYRISTFLGAVSPRGFVFNQFLVIGDEPLLFHCGQRALFPLVSAAVSRVLPIDRLKWISFGHVEADEFGSMDAWLDAAPQAQIVNGRLACNLSLNDLCRTPPRPIADGEILDIGGKRLRWIDTPHVPHGWEAGVMFEETDGVLLCGDLFAQIGDGPVVVEDDVVERAIASEQVFGACAPGFHVGRTLRKLAVLEPKMLALMHGSAFRGDANGQLSQLATWMDARETLE